MKNTFYRLLEMIQVSAHVVALEGTSRAASLSISFVTSAGSFALWSLTTGELLAIVYCTNCRFVVCLFSLVYWWGNIWKRWNDKFTQPTFVGGSRIPMVHYRLDTSINLWLMCGLVHMYPSVSYMSGLQGLYFEHTCRPARRCTPANMKMHVVHAWWGLQKSVHDALADWGSILCMFPQPQSFGFLFVEPPKTIGLCSRRGGLRIHSTLCGSI